ncbi:hypothetical protein THRCLA_00724 [Thraustotheca clavata]|uniref:SANT domain-containing protein n=1 Tax=Thraustotheca clavata TaxID=74557 RepID=A0A1W0AAG2_9STRA|nr:hypothetical protein THRCLA_00724 [Thraustotheca clavata]
MMIDLWTPYEVFVFELGLQHFGKQFHSIQQLICTKSTREVIAFYYIWKKFGLAKDEWTKFVPAKDPFGMKQMKIDREKHGILPTPFDLLSDDDDDTVLAVKQQSLQAAKKRRMEQVKNLPQCASPIAQKNCERMQNVHIIVSEYLSATRSLYAVNTDIDATEIQSYIKELRLNGAAQLKPVFSILSGLREKHILDTWTPFELCTFELGLELYGKHFHYISQLLPNKSTRETIALYYIWKVNNPIHDQLKQKWSQA